jgi:hypothetical protein
MGRMTLPSIGTEVAMPIVGLGVTVTILRRAAGKRSSL